MKFTCSKCKNIILSGNNICQNCGTEYKEITCEKCSKKFWSCYDRVICDTCHYTKLYHDNKKGAKS